MSGDYVSEQVPWRQLKQFFRLRISVIQFLAAPYGKSTQEIVQVRTRTHQKILTIMWSSVVGGQRLWIQMNNGYVRMQAPPVELGT